MLYVQIAIKYPILENVQIFEFNRISTSFTLFSLVDLDSKNIIFIVHVHIKSTELEVAKVLYMIYGLGIFLNVEKPKCITRRQYSKFHSFTPLKDQVTIQCTQEVNLGWMFTKFYTLCECTCFYWKCNFSQSIFPIESYASLNFFRQHVQNSSSSQIW